MYFVKFLVVPFAFSVARQPDGAQSFPHVDGHRLAGVELDARAVALEELVPRQRQVAMQQDALEVLEQLLVGEADLDLGRTRLDRVVAGVVQPLADRRLTWSEHARCGLQLVHRRTDRCCTPPT